MYKIIEEGKARIKVPFAKKISKQMEVFYNPVMKLNRDISVLLLNSINKKGMQIALPLAGTGVRGVRFILELEKGKIKGLSFNDHNKKATDLIKKNLKLNNIKSKNVEIYNKDANNFLLESSGFDYIDVDPFGTPNPFLDSAVKRISREGILAITATDTSSLSGTYPDACLRKYWAMPLKNEFMHESGIRILIRKVQLIGAEHEKALVPIFSYSKEHYFRLFFKCDKGKQKVDKVLKKHGFVLYCKDCLNREISEINLGMCCCGNSFEAIGPMWLGDLWDNKLVKNMVNKNKDSNLNRFLETILEEAKIKVVGFYDIHKVVKKHKLKSIPKKDFLIERIKNKGLQVCETHFAPNTIRTNANIKELVGIIRKI